MKSLLILSLSFLVGCGSPDKERAASPADSAMLVRQEIYSAAIGKLKGELKAPTTAKIPSVTLKNDTVRIFQKGDTAVVATPYDAQNVMGVYLRDYAAILLFRDSSGWSNRYTSMLPIMEDDYRRFDKFAPWAIDVFNGGRMPETNY